MTKQEMIKAYQKSLKKIEEDQANFEEEDVKIKLFSVIVKNDGTVKTINKIRDERGNFSIKYVLRNGAYTEIIYQDTYKEI